jgi:hypothetical protein
VLCYGTHIYGVLTITSLLITLHMNHSVFDTLISNPEKVSCNNSQALAVRFETYSMFRKVFSAIDATRETTQFHHSDSYGGSGRYIINGVDSRYNGSENCPSCILTLPSRSRIIDRENAMEELLVEGLFILHPADKFSGNVEYVSILISQPCY